MGLLSQQASSRAFSKLQYSSWGKYKLGSNPWFILPGTESDSRSWKKSSLNASAKSEEIIFPELVLLRFLFRLLFPANVNLVTGNLKKCKKKIRHTSVSSEKFRYVLVSLAVKI